MFDVPNCKLSTGPQARRGLAQSVDPFDLALGQSADARMRSAGIGDGERHHDLVGARRVGDAHLHAVKMAPHKGRVLVAERHVERDARAAALLGRGNERRAFAQNLAHRRAELGVQHRGGVFELAVLPHCRRLAVALRVRSLDAERRNGALGEQRPELLADVDQQREILDITAGERIIDHCDDGGAPRRRVDGAIHFDARLLDESHELSNLGFHLSPSNPLTLEASRPPARLCTRGPVVIASASRISSARGASATPTSIASKWLRTYDALIWVIGTSRRAPGPATFFADGTIAIAPPSASRIA